LLKPCVYGETEKQGNKAAADLVQLNYYR